jgi:spore germination protein KA
MSVKEAKGPALEQRNLTADLDTNLKIIRELLAESNDVVIREFLIAQKTKAAILCVDGLLDKEVVQRNVLRPLIVDAAETSFVPRYRLKDYVCKNLLTAEDIKEEKDIREILNKILSGDTALLIDKEDAALIIASRGFATRSVTEPSSEAVVRGPRESFTESMRTNTSLIRRKINNPDLVFESFTLGSVTNTLVTIVYLKGIAKEDLVREVKQRIRQIEIDGIFDTGYIEQLIEEHPYSPFATTGYTEKPDVLAARILEGRVGILVDGSPNAITVPLLFIEKFQTADDYYTRPLFTSLIRIIRILSFTISVISPSLYIILVSFQPELLPTPLLVTFANAVEGTPFPAVVEVGVMMFILEIIREAGVRMPRPIGPAVGIVGSLVMGESAVSAGLIGQPLVIVIALTAITSYIVPTLYDESALLRILFYVFTSFFGIIGFVTATVLIVIHLASLQPFGVPFMSPFMPFEGEDIKDSFLRAPLWLMKRRPQVLGGKKRFGERPKSSIKGEDL